MRRSRLVSGLVVGGVVCATALVTSLSAIAAPATTHSGTEGRVLRYDIRFRPLEENFVDVGSPGPGIGDMLVFQDQIIDRHSGRQVGVEAGSCTITAVLEAGFQTHCVGTVSLPAGQIAFQGLASNAPEKRMAIVGGTGRYRTAAGELTVLELGENEAGTLTIRLADR
jgi:hypothetical protein